MNYTDWNGKVDSLRAEYEALDKKVYDTLGRGGGEYVNARPQYSITTCIQKAKAKHLMVCEVETDGAPCVILISRLYPEMGILLWDAPCGSSAGAIRLAHGHYENAQWSLVCSCCRPHLSGVADDSDEVGALNHWVSGVRKACKRVSVSKLYFKCSDHGIRPEQDVDGLRFLHRKNLTKELDRWQFIAAFSEIEICEESSPFDKFFGR